MNIVLLDAFTADQGTAAWPGLDELGHVESHARTSAADRAARARDAHALITNKVPVDAALMHELPALRYIGVSATGTNIIDVDAARTRGIAVTNVPGYSTESVAQLVFAFLLQSWVDVAGHAADVRAGGWSRQRDFSYALQPLRELAGKTIVIVGLGAIGGAVARIARAFGMVVVAAAVPGSRQNGHDRVPLDEALPRADVVTLHCPLTPATERMVDERFLAALRPHALLVNTSRGGLVDEAALLAAVVQGRIGGAALDVLTQEPPPPDHPLLCLPPALERRVIVTPHLAWATVEARARLRLEVVENLRAFLGGKRRNRVD